MGYKALNSNVVKNNNKDNFAKVNKLKKNTSCLFLKDAGIGSRPDLYEGAKKNSPGYRMYEDGLEMDIFVKNSSRQPLVGKVKSRIHHDSSF